MIPTIGVMVGAYILFRCFETFLFAPSRYGSGNRFAAAMVAAVLLGLLTLICMLSLLTSGQTGP